MQIYYYTSNDAYKTYINSTKISQIGFWFMTIFYSMKVVLFCMAYSSFRRAFYFEHRHTDCCQPVAPVGAAASGAYGPVGSQQVGQRGGRGNMAGMNS